MDRTSSNTDLPRLLARIDRRRLALTEHLWSGPKGLVDIVMHLADSGPQNTAQLVEYFKLERNSLAVRLRAGARFHLLAEKKNAASYGPGKIGRSASDWSVNRIGATALARVEVAPRPPSIIDTLPAKFRDILERWDFEAEELTAQKAWRIAELAAALRSNTITASLRELDALLGRTQRGGYAKVSVTLAERKGHIRVHRPERKGVLGRPSNDYSAMWETFKPRPSGARRQLAPQRSPQQLGDLDAPKDLRTADQRRWCNAIGWETAGLKNAQYWADAQTLFAAIGTSRVVAYDDLSAQLGIGRTAIEKTVRRLKAAGLLELKRPKGGHGGTLKEWCPDWSKLQSLAGDKAKSVRKRKATTLATESATPTWDATAGELQHGAESCSFAAQARNARAVLDAFQAAACRTGSQAHFAIPRLTRTRSSPLTGRAFWCSRRQPKGPQFPGENAKLKGELKDLSAKEK